MQDEAKPPSTRSVQKEKNLPHRAWAWGGRAAVVWASSTRCETGFRFGAGAWGERVSGHGVNVCAVVLASINGTPTPTPPGQIQEGQGKRTNTNSLAANSLAATLGIASYIVARVRSCRELLEYSSTQSRYL